MMVGGGSECEVDKESKFLRDDKRSMGSDLDPTNSNPNSPWNDQFSAQVVTN